MSRIVIRPRIQIPVLVVIFAVDPAGRHVLVTIGIAGIWRALRLGVVIDGEGVRVRGFDNRDQVTPWSAIQSVGCAQIDVRGGLPLYAPVLRLGDDGDAMPLSALGSYSWQDVERKVEQLRSLKAGTTRF